jgi:hypothetical protein
MIDLVQMCESGQKSGRLVFRDRAWNQKGFLCFDKGRLVYAKSDSFEGEEAVYDLLGMRKGFLEFHGTSGKIGRNVEQNARAVLLNAAMMRDEFESVKKGLKDFDRRLRLRSCTLSPELRRKCGERYLLAVMTLVSEGRTVLQILKSGHMSALRAGYILANLLEEKIATPVAGPGEKNRQDKRRRTT